MSERTDTKRARVLLVLIALLYAGFLLFYVRRLNNFVLSDREFTGWVGPIAERLARGERPYTDFVLPIPPGSFVLLAIIQKLAGRALLLQELWVAAVSHLVMGLMAYAFAVRFSTRKVALLVTLVTLVLVTQTPKECAYDHTSLLVAWLSVLLGSSAALCADPARARRLWFLTGLCATGTLCFKQSTAAGMVAGWAVGVLYLVAVEWRARRREATLNRLREALWCGAGGVGGLFVVLLLLFATRSSVPGFVQTVLRDGPALKGGTRALLLNLFNFTTRHDAIRATVVPTALVAAVGLGVARRRGNLHIGDEPERGPSLSRGSVALLAIAAIATFGSAIALLAGEARALQRTFTAVAETMRNVPAYGFVFGVAFFAAHLVDGMAKDDRARRTGHALNAVLLATVTSSLIYDTSYILFVPFYYNEPSIPVVLLCFFVATERSGLPWATPLALAASMLPAFGPKLDRALSDDVVVQTGQWAGLRVNYRGVEVLKAATRAQALAGPSGTVLVLPEDMEIAGVIQRPRPKVQGAILFVDQYPERLLSHDLAVLDRNPPDVIVIHPRRAPDWQTLYHTWSPNSAAERVLNHVLTKLLPKYYQLDSTYPTIFFWDQAQIDVYARKPEGAP